MLEIRNTEVYTREEAEALLKISQSTMMRLIKTGVIRAAKIGGQYRILGSELLRQFLPDAGYVVVRDVYRESRKKVHQLEADVLASNTKSKESNQTPDPKLGKKQRQRDVQ